MPVREKNLATHLIKTKPKHSHHIDDVNLYRLRKFILKNGQPAPVIIDHRRELVDGEFVLETLKSLGIRTTKVLLLSTDNAITKSKIRKACRKVLCAQ